MGIVIFFSGLSLSSKSQDTLPVNPATGLVSVNNVMALENKSVSQLKGIAEGFIAMYADKNTLLAQKQTQYKKDKKLPLFSAIKTLEQDSALAYDCMMKVFVPHSGLGVPSSSDNDIISFKISFYFKTNKVKYDITSFSHTYVGIRNGGNGGKFENEKPDDFKRLIGSGKKEWMEIKQKAVTSARQIAGIIEETFKKDNTKQLDF